MWFHSTTKGDYFTWIGGQLTIYGARVNGQADCERHLAEHLQTEQLEHGCVQVMDQDREMSPSWLQVHWLTSDTNTADAAADTDDTDDTSGTEATNTAMMGMMMGMMNQPAFVPRGRAPSRSVPTPAFVPSASSLPVSQTPTPKPVSTYRDATYCVSLGQPYNGNMILPVTNHCNGPITVHFGTGVGGEFLNLRGGQERGYTTIERRVAYACFRKSDQDDYCFKSSTD